MKEMCCMSIKDISEAFTILGYIEATSSRNEKEDALKSGKDNEVLRELLKATYDPFTVYNIKKIPQVKPEPTTMPVASNYDQFLNLLHALSTRTITGNAAIEAIADFMYYCNDDEQKWYSKVIQKDLKIGITDKTINKTMKGLVPVFDCALAYPIKKFPRNFMCNRKLDGYRCLAIHDHEGNVELRTRNGKLIEGYAGIEQDIFELPKGFVYDGEIMAPTGSFADMQKNAFKKGITDKQGVLNIFDVIPLDEFKNGKSEKKLRERVGRLLDLDENYIDTIPLWNLQIVEPGEFLTNNEEGITRAYELHAQFTSEGYEGTMVNDLDGYYVCKRSYNIQKIKDFYEIDLYVVAVYEGEAGTKYEGTMGGVMVDLSDRDIIEQLPEKMHKFVEGETFQVGVGSGWSDEQRRQYWENTNLIVGKFIQIKFQEVTLNEKGEHSLRFPTVVKIRDDK
jgi:DNA ligase-1